METNNHQKSNELFSESAKIANKWFNDATSSMMELFNKQLNSTYSFYNNLFNSFWGGNRNAAFPFPNFFGMGNGSDRLMNPFSWMKEDGNANVFSGIYENMFRQMSDYNKNLLNSMQSSFHGRQNDMVLLTERYQHLMEKNWEAIKNSMNVLTEAYNHQMESSITMNKKVYAEMNKLANTLLKSNEEFWMDAAKTYQATARGERARKTERREVEHA